MRLVVFSSVFPDAGHPVRGTFNLALVRALADEHHVAVVSPRRVIERGSRYRRPPDAVAVGADPILYPTWFHPVGLSRATLHHYMGAFVGRPLRSLIGRWAADAVVAYFAHPDGSVAVRAARRAGVPVVVMVGGSDVLIDTSRPRRRAVIARTLAEADAVVTVSESLRRAVVALGVSPERVHTIAQGVDSETFRPGPEPGGPPVLLWVGRMAKVKRLDVLVDAFGEVHRVRPDVRLRLVGDGPERRRLSRQVRQAGLEDWVDFAGNRSPKEVAADMREASLVVLTSDSEGIPNVLREALASGVPFVSTDVGGVGELAQPGWSWLVPPGDPLSVARALLDALEQGRPQELASLPTWSHSAARLTSLVGALR